MLVAEGYVFEFERRGYLRAGCFVPEVVLEHPNLVRNMHEEFVHAGSDVVLAFTVIPLSETFLHLFFHLSTYASYTLYHDTQHMFSRLIIIKSQVM